MEIIVEPAIGTLQAISPSWACPRSPEIHRFPDAAEAVLRFVFEVNTVLTVAKNMAFRIFSNIFKRITL
jgi:hypothetical protein